MSWDYERIDREMAEELYRESVWLCPLCGATRDIEDWHNFTSQFPPTEPCRFCGARLTHGIKSEDGRSAGPWYPRRDEFEDEFETGSDDDDV